jgi:hypothetical protein
MIHFYDVNYAQKLTGYNRRISDKELQLVTKGGLIDIGGGFWTTEKLVDQLFYALAKKEAVPEIVTVPCNSNGTDSIDLLEQYESSKTLLRSFSMIQFLWSRCLLLEIGSLYNRAINGPLKYWIY